MKCFFFLVMLSVSAAAGFKEDHKADLEYCKNLTKDATKVAMINEKWTLTKSYIASLEEEPDLLRSQMFCDMGSTFGKNFEKKYQPKFEVLAKKRLSVAEVEAIQMEFLELVYKDKPKARLDAFRGKWAGIEGYFDEKMRVVLAKRTKPAKNKK
jgi:hypothetical protein